MSLAIVVAMSSNRVIGVGGDLPWVLPSDLRRFKAITIGHTVIMGRKTADSIRARLGGPLPDRRNIVLSRQERIEGCEVVGSVEEAIRAARGETAFVAGGSEVYSQFLPHVDKILMTLVEDVYDGDAYFPFLPPVEWEMTETSKIQFENDANFRFVTYERR